MNNLLGMLLGSLTQQSTVNATSKKTGISTRTILTILSYALPLIIRSMTKNASNQSGAQSLLGALTQHKSTRSIEDQISEADEVDGSKIIGHIFGNNSNEMLGQIANNTGASQADVSKVLSNIAPALLSSVSAATTAASNNQQAGGKGFDLSDGLDLGDLTAILGKSSTTGNLTSMLGGLLGGGAEQASASVNDAKDNGGDLLSSLMSFMK